MKILTIIAIIAGIVAFSFGLLIGHFVMGTHKAKGIKKSSIQFNFQDSVTKSIISRINSQNIKKELSFLSSKPHLVASDRDLELANYLKESWRRMGLDKAELVPYDLLLSFPSAENENKVEIIESNGTPVFTSRTRETLNGQLTDVGPGYLSHTPAGDVSGDLVYVNYGTPEDLDLLETIGVDVKGKICIAKYGRGFRGNKIETAAVRGSIGVILYLDPADVAQKGMNSEDLYPNTWWLPGDGIQRGSALTEDGDPSTPGYPSLSGVYRVPKDDQILPKIPAQPIGYSDAEMLLNILGGNQVPENWKGGLNITYKFGPGFNAENVGRKCRIATFNRQEIKTANNVIGWIEGSQEPDRYVLLGNHRDAWGYGAVDPTSGTAVMLEIIRVLGSLHKEGWRPKRSLVFCSWVAEEQGIMGSTEWVEENIQKLYSRAVVYLNVDIAVNGGVFAAEGSPMLTEAILRVADMVPDSEQKGKSLFDVWSKYFRDLNGSEKPQIFIPGSGTDHAAFYFYAGIPSATFSYAVDKTKYNVSSYPSYHTAYDTFDYVEKFLDPKFVLHETLGKFLGVLVYYFTDSVVIPYNLSDYSQTLRKGFQELNGPGQGKLKQLNISMSSLDEGILNFQEAAAKLHEMIKSLDLTNVLKVRSINDKLLMVERSFIKLRGLPGRPFVRHLLYSPSQYNSYAQSQFSVISDTLQGVEKLSGEEILQRKQIIEEYVSDLTLALESAANLIDTGSTLYRSVKRQ